MAPVTQLQLDPFGLVGTTLGGKYTIECLVAETHLSIVYRANHRVWRRPVAIKAFKALAHDETREQRLESFVREGVLLMDLSERCASICQARDVGSTITSGGDWIPYMVLEWLEGESLEDVLERERQTNAKPRDAAQAIRLLQPIAKALAVAHELRVVHGDVKPGNIFLLPENGRVGPRSKLLDFGIARVLQTAGARSPAEPLALKSFTPAYGAPEQFGEQHGSLGPWTDVFALALICVEIITGREPFRSTAVHEIEAEACNPQVRPTARTLGGDVSDAIEQVLARALAVRPEDRYPDAREFWSALRRAADDAETAQEQPRPSESPPDEETRNSAVSIPVALTRSRPPSRRRWMLPAMAAAFGAAFVALQLCAPWLPTARTEAMTRWHALQSAVMERAASLASARSPVARTRPDR